MPRKRRGSSNHHAPSDWQPGLCVDERIYAGVELSRRGEGEEGCEVMPTQLRSRPKRPARTPSPMYFATKPS